MINGWISNNILQHHAMVMVYSMWLLWAIFQKISTRPKQWARFLIDASSLKQMSTGRHVASLLKHYSNIDQISLRSYSLIVCTNYIIFGLTQREIKSMIFYTQVQHSLYKSLHFE